MQREFGRFVLKILSLEDLAANAGLSQSLLAGLEAGQEVPSLETFDRLAVAVDVPLQNLFYGNRDSTLTPWLTPRPTLQELIGESCPSTPDNGGPQTNTQAE